MWERELDLLVPMWQGAADIRVREGAEALAGLVTLGNPRVRVAVPLSGSERENGVLHLEAVTAGWRAQSRLLEQHRPERLLTLGGDCSVEVASVAYMARTYGERLFVLWIDAHGDLNTPASSPSGTAHGMPLRLLLEGDAPGPLPAPGCLGPTQVALAGARDLDTAEAEYVLERSLPWLKAAALESAPTSLAELPPPGAAVYVHLDLDVVDPIVLPAVAVPSPGGLTAVSLVQALTAVLSQHEVVGVGVTEYVPQVEHDHQVVSSVLAALGLTGKRRDGCRANATAKRSEG